MMRRCAAIGGLRLIASLMLVALLCEGCASGSKKQVVAEQPIGPAGLTVSQIQSELMSYADTLSDLVAQAADDVAQMVQDPQERLTVTQFKLQTVRGAFAIAAGPNPVIGVVDMTVMVTLSAQVAGMYLAEEGVTEIPGTPIVTAVGQAEREVWKVAARVMDEGHLEEVRTLITQWREDNPNQTYVANIRFSDFAPYRRTMVTTGQGRSGSLFGLVGLDPLAGLDPTTREIEQTRLLAERMFFYASRMPTLLSWQAEELAWRMAAAPETRQIIDDINRFAAVSERYAAFAERVPEDVDARLRAQRIEAVEQLHEVIIAEREALFSELNSENEALDTTLRELRTTVDSGNELARSLNVAVTSIDNLTSKFISDEPEPQPEPSEPVHLSDIQKTIEQSTVAIAELDNLVTNLDSVLNSPQSEARMEELQGLMAIAEASGQRLLNRGFLLLAAIVILFFGGAVAKSYLTAGTAGKATGGAAGTTNASSSDVRPTTRV